jgi:hypothetical protein
VSSVTWYPNGVRSEHILSTAVPCSLLTAGTCCTFGFSDKPVKCPNWPAPVLYGMVRAGNPGSAADGVLGGLPPWTVPLVMAGFGMIALTGSGEMAGFSELGVVTSLCDRVSKEFRDPYCGVSLGVLSGGCGGCTCSMGLRASSKRRQGGITDTRKVVSRGVEFC